MVFVAGRREDMTGKKLVKDRRLYVMFSVTLIGVMGVATLTPALPKIAQALDLSKSEIALLISAFTFPGIFLTPVGGVLADRLGRKTVLVPSLFIFGLAGFSIFSGPSTGSSFLGSSRASVLLRWDRSISHSWAISSGERIARLPWDTMPAC